MPGEMIAKDRWRAFCDRLSQQLEGAHAEIEVAGLGIGDQVQAEWVPLLGVTYDPKDDIFAIAVEGLVHVVPWPESLHVQFDGTLVSGLAVVTRSGDSHIVRLRKPLALPAPEARQ